MKIIIITTIAVALLLTGIAVGFQAGRSAGFETGSEWALVQAELLAREAGVYMPVHLDENGFRVVIKQPRGLYKKARQRAEEYDQEREGEIKTAKLQKPDEEETVRNVQQAEF